MKILIIEDEVLLADSLRTMLERVSPSRLSTTARQARNMPRRAYMTC